MRRAMLFVVLLSILECACKDSGEQPTADDLIGITGMVIAKSAQFYVIQCDVPIQDGVRTFYPLNLSNPFRRDGLRVRISGRVEADPLTDYAYLPVRITFIQSIE